MAKIPPGPKDLVLNGKIVGQYISTGDTELDLPIALAKLRELGHEQPEVPEWMHIRQQAIYFQDTCALLLRVENSRPIGARPFAAIPYVVNSAFCVELYLKALALKHGKKLRGHDLLELYKNLPADALNDIELSIPEALRDAPVDGIPDIREFVSMMSSVFVQWRYAYEQVMLKELRMDVLRFMRMLMFLACRNVVPTSTK